MFHGNTNVTNIPGEIFKFNTLSELMNYAQTCTEADKEIWEYLSNATFLNNLLKKSRFEDIHQFIITPLLNNKKFTHINALKISVCKQAWSHPMFLDGLLAFLDSSSLAEINAFVRAGFRPRELSRHFQILEHNVSQIDINFASYCCYALVTDDITRLSYPELFIAYQHALHHDLPNIAKGIKATMNLMFYKLGDIHAFQEGTIINFSKSDLYSHNFFKQPMAYANLKKCNLRAVNFHNANLSHADMSDTILHKAIIRGAILIGVNLQRTSFVKIDYFFAPALNAELKHWHDQLIDHPQSETVKDAIVNDLLRQSLKFSQEERVQIIETACEHPLFKNNDSNYIRSFFFDDKSVHQKKLTASLIKHKASLTADSHKTLLPKMYSVNSPRK